ncbi:hypothetical protein BLOT_013798 [Blomia tropicalis]|nr:hypothetical protein BLOT_013798 [Blomia tropicalis]
MDHIVIKCYLDCLQSELLSPHDECIAEWGKVAENMKLSYEMNLITNDSVCYVYVDDDDDDDDDPFFLTIFIQQQLYNFETIRRIQSTVQSVKTEAFYDDIYFFLSSHKGRLDIVFNYYAPKVTFSMNKTL